MPKKDKNDNKLNQRVKDFCKYYIELKWNKTQAAIKAGYSKKTAPSQGSRLLKNVNVQDYLNKLIESGLGMERSQLRQMVLSELKDIATVDITNDINVVTKKRLIPRKTEDGKIIPGEFDEEEYQTVEIIDTKNSKQTRAIKSISQDKDGVIKVEYYSKDVALDKLAKYGGLYQDNTLIVNNSTDNSVTNNVDYSNLTPEEAKQAFLDKINNK